MEQKRDYFNNDIILNISDPNFCPKNKKLAPHPLSREKYKQKIYFS